MSSKPVVVVAMSGGVDSSVAAARLMQDGYQVIGMMLRLWSEPGTEESNRCCTPEAMYQARRVAAKLGIPFYALDVRERFRERVVQYFLDGYATGGTPNPCVVCNREIRWGLLYDEARILGADFLATGHYARLREGENGAIQLLRGADSIKDQSYVLSVISQEKLRHSLFPVGEMGKSAVRQQARELELASAERPESQDLCFLAGQDYREFLAHHAPETQQPGPILDLRGKQIGMHNGLANYTIGQRRGLVSGAPGALYVISKDIQKNALIIGGPSELGRDCFDVGEVNWITTQPLQDSLECTVKIRYRAKEVPARIEISSNRQVQVHILQPLRDITPGQRAVFYKDEVCLGGGTILN